MNTTRRLALIFSMALLAGYDIATAQEARLGRLFYTPEERQKINEKRGVISSASSAPQVVTINGMVVRSGQPAVLFIDGKESKGAAGSGSAALQLSQGVPLKTEGGQTIVGKPGQIVDLANGRAIENYQLVPGMPDPNTGEAHGAPDTAPRKLADPAANTQIPGFRSPPLRR